MRTFVGVTLSLSLAATVFLLTIGPRASSARGLVEVVVAPGDTLWSIAVRLVPEADPRHTIDRIMNLNGLTAPCIIPGQRLLAPGAP